MSISIEANNSPKVTTTYECQNVSWSGKACTPDCYECQGLGVVKFTNPKHEVRWSNGNAIYWLTKLGLEDPKQPDYCGEIKAEDVIHVMLRLESLIQTDSPHHANRLGSLLRVLNWAQVHGEPVYWG